MKVYFEFETYKGICLSLADEIAKVKPDILVCVPRKAMFPTQIIYEYLKMDVAYFFPKTNTLFFPPDIDQSKIKKLMFIDDCVSPQARTFKQIAEFMKDKPFEWNFISILIDYRTNIQEDEHFLAYGLKIRENPWFVFPYEKEENITENDFTYFRDKGGKDG